MNISMQMLQRIGTVAGVLTISAVSIGSLARTQATHMQAPKAYVRSMSAGNASSVVTNVAPDPVANVIVDGQRVDVPNSGTVVVPTKEGVTSTVSHSSTESGKAVTTVTNETPSNSVSVSITTDAASKANTNNFTNFQSSSFGQSYESSNNFIYSTGGMNITNSN